MEELGFLLGILFIPLIAQIFVTVTYAKYKREKNSNKLTGYDIARKILDNNGLKDMYVVQTKGTMSDHYDSSRKTIRLSSEVYNGTTIAALAIAAHESGHALQDKDGYLFMRIRSLIFPIVSVGTKLAYFVLIAGILFEMANLLWVAVLMVSLGLIFQIITLPVEFNASNRAKDEILKHNLAVPDDLYGVNKMLKAAAFTYVAGVLSSALELIRLIAIINNRD